MPVADALTVALPANPADRLAALFDAHYDRLYRLARRLAPSIDDALDLVQETFLRPRVPRQGQHAEGVVMRSATDWRSVS
jgi:sigma-70-like protein